MIKPTDVFDALVAAGFSQKESQDWVNEATRAKHMLRDDFAKAAFSGLLAAGEGSKMGYRDLVESAWSLADAMVEGRHRE